MQNVSKHQFGAIRKEGKVLTPQVHVLHHSIPNSISRGFERIVQRRSPQVPENKNDKNNKKDGILARARLVMIEMCASASETFTKFEPCRLIEYFHILSK